MVQQKVVKIEMKGYELYQPYEIYEKIAKLERKLAKLKEEL